MWKKIKDSKWLYVVLSILMSIILWGYVIKDVNPEQPKPIYNIPITFTGTDVLTARGLIISEGKEQTMSITFRAKADVVSKMGRDNITLKVDVSKIVEPGTYRQMVEIAMPPNVTPGTYSVDTGTDDLYVELTVSKLEAKEIPVKGEFMGSVAEGHQLGDITVTPATVSIQGQQELVNQVAYVKVILTQQDMNTTYTGDLPFKYIDASGEELTGLNVTANVETIHVTFPVVMVKEIPLSVDIIPGGGATAEHVKLTYGAKKLEEMTLDVSGSEEALAGLDNIVVGQIDLAKVVTTQEFRFPIDLGPDLVNESGITEVTVTATIEGLTTREFDVDNIQLINAPESYTPEAVTQSRTVMVRGPEAAVNAIFKSQLRIVVDVSAGIPTPAVGRYDIPARVYLDGSSSVGVVGTYNIAVSLSR